MHCRRHLAAVILGCAVILGQEVAMSQNVRPELDPAEHVGERPYEMVWANRREPSAPLLRFDDLRGWSVAVSGGAEASLEATRAQNLWDRPVARLRYRGTGKADAHPSVQVRLAAPLPVPAGADCVNLWVYGNRWSWMNPPDTPEVTIWLHYRDATGADVPHRVHGVGWDEWWLVHDLLPKGLKLPAVLEAIEVTGGWQTAWKDLHFDSLTFYREDREPLRCEPRPRRPHVSVPGAIVGANTGPGVLPFPTRRETILPRSAAGGSANAMARDGAGWRFTYTGSDARVAYTFDPALGLAGVRAEVGGKPVGAAMSGGGVRHAEGAPASTLLRVTAGRSKVAARYSDGTVLTLQVAGKSLIVDVANPGATATGIELGEVAGVTDPRPFYVPPITFGKTDPMVLLSRAGRARVFTSIWLDWYRSNGTELYGAEGTTATTARINGGVRYVPRTDGVRNPVHDRIVVTCSPVFEEVLPVIANPRAIHLDQAKECLWQETWGPTDHAREIERGRMLRGYGIQKLIQCNHEIGWRDGGESFTLRVHAAPKKGGDEALARYVAAQRANGWYSGLYTNYTDFIPVNEHWDPDYVSRNADGNWRGAWPRCYGLKPLRAVELDHRLAPLIKARYNSNSAYTDVHTAVPPWGYVDMDARLPGAGTFTQTFYAYGELLRNDSRVYGGPIFSEGTYQWLYAGLADGNYALTYNRHKLATAPLLPAFDLREIHTRECDIGCGWTAHFCEAIPNWSAPESIDRSIDRFLLHTMAYGHIGWLVEEAHGIRRTCRSYYMLQQVQARCGGMAPRRIAYWDGKRLVDTSTAIERDLPGTRRQMMIEFEGGLRLWLNDHATETWNVQAGPTAVSLPPAGWAAWQPGSAGDPGGLVSYSGLHGSRRVDYLRSRAYTYLDGRGAWFSAPEGASDGAMAITSPGRNWLRVIRIEGGETFVVRRAYGVQGALARCTARDAQGRPTAAPKTSEADGGVRIWPVKDAVRYDLVFDAGSRAASARPRGARSQAAPRS